MSELKHGALFNGIGGFCLAAQWAGIETLWTCEIDEFCNKVSKQHFPNATQYGDIRELRKPPYVDIISGGFPCQDISVSGKGEGITGARSGLWGEYNRIIREVNPSYVVIENSPQLLRKGFEKVLYDLSESGYNAEWQCLQASTFGAPHQRERVLVVAYLQSLGSICGKVFNTEYYQNHSKRERDQATIYIEVTGNSYLKVPTSVLLDDGIPPPNGREFKGIW